MPDGTDSRTTAAATVNDARERAGAGEPTGGSGAVVKVVDRRWWARGDAADAESGALPSDKPTYVQELEKFVAEYRRGLAEGDVEYHLVDTSRPPSQVLLEFLRGRQ